MPKIDLYFDGYCPESLLQGNLVEMKLNEDDFWESESTGLQICISPPYATILRWRGKGNLKQSSANASDVLTGLILVESATGKGPEIFPDETAIIANKSMLETYLSDIR